MINIKLLNKLIELGLEVGGEFVEIFEEETITNTFKMMNSLVENVGNTTIAGLGIRIYYDNKSVYAYSNDFNEDVLMNMISKLGKGIDNNKDDDSATATASTSINIKEEVYDNAHPIRIKPLEMSSKDKVKLMLEVSEAANNYSSLVDKTICTLFDETQKVRITNSTGKLINDCRIRTRMSIQAFALKNDNQQVGHKSSGGSIGYELYTPELLNDLGKEAARIAVAMLEAIDAPSGKMDVVLDHGFGGVIFHEACGHGLEATAIAKHQSIFDGKVGKQIASTIVSAVDDGTITNAWGSTNIDDEGNFTKRNILIKDGILQGYLVDQLNGEIMKTKSTGSGRRESYHYEPTSRMTNTYIMNGKSTLEELISSTKHGLYAKTLGGGSVDPATGDFNFALMEAYLIEDGKIGQIVKGATLVGNGADVLMNISMVANNLTREQGMCGSISGSIPTDVGQPAIKVLNMNVGGSAND
ncbi:MAG: TldD/PmbA family protein [Erysipelotrichaceae bacterium]